MSRLPLLIAFATAIALCIGCSHPIVSQRYAPASANDVSEIYGKFLDRWTGKEKSPINVSTSAELPSSEDLEQFSDCAREGGSNDVHWLPTKPMDDLNNTVGNLPYVRLVDRQEWQPQDPGDLISQGKSIESAVDRGFAHGLLTFSAITFDESGKTAAFTYSFVCGGLCGNGAAVIFTQTQSGWVQNKRQCRGWMS